MSDKPEKEEPIVEVVSENPYIKKPIISKPKEEEEQIYYRE